MDNLMQQIAIKKAELDRLRPLAPAGLASLEHYYDLELTYTSNAIEGNTLSAAETMLVIENGITIGGKPLKDHLEAIDHYDAIRYVREIAGRGTPLAEIDTAPCTARLLMNLNLIRGGYPPVSVRPEDRLSYVRGLQQAQAGHGTETFERLLDERLDTILVEYLSALDEALAAP